ncbi:MAG: TonB-dependent receptor [Myxococcota bacterium]
MTATRAVAADEDESGHAHEHEHEEHSDVETIVVTASPLAHERDELALPVDRVEREDLLLNLGSTLGETLNKIPGISTTGFAAGASRPVVRGQDAYRTEVLEDGLRTQDVSQESPDHAVPVNPLAAERVEVIRGPATLRYGGGASAGVVNVITNRVPDQLPEEKISGEVFGGIGLVADERDVALSLDGAAGDFAWHADGVIRTANDYKIPNNSSPRVQSGTQVDSFTGSVGGAYFFEDARLGFSYTRAENNYGIPEEGEGVEIEMLTDRFRFEADLEDPIPGLRSIRLRGVYSDYEHDEVAGGEVGQTYRNEEFESRLEFLHEPVLGFTGAIGVQARTRDFVGEGEAAEFLSPTETTTAALYFFEETALAENWTAEFGFRFESTEVDGRGIDEINRDRHFFPLSGSAGIVGKPMEGLTLGFTANVSQRAPAQAELFARGAHEATETFELGDSQLDEETSYTGEFRAEYKGSRGRIEWSGFVTQYDDFIFASRTGNFVDEEGNAPGELAELEYLARDALFYGSELVGELDLFNTDWGTFGLDGRFDIVRARFDNGSNANLPRIVPIRIGGGVFFDSESLDARVGFVRTEAQNRTGAFESSTASYTHLNASIRYSLEPVAELPIDFSITATNLTDVRGRNHIAFNKDEVLLPGRNVRFGVRARF